MSIKRAQASSEFLISLIFLLIILVSMYEVSASMSQRKDLIASQFEGEKISARISNAISWAEISGTNTTSIITPYSYPEQTIIISGGQVISFGLSGRTIAISPIMANTSAGTGLVNSNQTLRVNYNGTNATITQLG